MERYFALHCFIEKGFLLSHASTNSDAEEKLDGDYE